MVSTRIAVVCVVVLVSLAGCSGADLAANNGDADESGAGNLGDDPGAEQILEETDVEDAPSQRVVIRSGTVHSEVSDFDAARENLTAVVREQGGYVSDSTEQTSGSDETRHTSGRIVYRVPAENFTDTFEDIKQEGRVTRSNTNTTDVTEQIADLDARLQNLRAQRDRLRTLYEQANDTEDVLAVGERLSSVQGEIERLEARRQALDEQVNYSTITVRLTESTPTEDEPSAWYETDVLDAFLESIGGVAVVARSIVVGTAYILPYLIAFGIPLVGVGVLFWWWRD